MTSQAQIVGAPPMKTWDDYEHGCLTSFGGGYRTEEEREIFRHGMSTIFNLLRHEFPPADVCKAAAQLRSELAVEGNALRAAATFIASAATESFFLEMPESSRAKLREALGKAEKDIEAAISPNSRRMLIKQEFEIAHWKEKADEAVLLRQRLSAIAAKLEEAVCTEGCDKGVVLLSDHGRTHDEEINGRMVSVYDHEYFSPLGDALIAAWHLTQLECAAADTQRDSLLSTCRAVLHQLEHGEAGEGDKRDIAWCVRTLREAVGAEGGGE